MPRIAIIAPAGIPVAANVYRACAELRRRGYEPVVGPRVFCRHFSFAGTDDERLADLLWAFQDPTIDAILCARGGYGCARLLERLADVELPPKPLIGFSDVTALHALLASCGIPSIHGPMTSHIARGGEDIDTLFQLLEGEAVRYTLPSHPLNCLGKATGPLLGGNLAVMQALIDTPYDLMRPGAILFVEDIAEPLYKLDRIMMQLRLSGKLQLLAGLIVGQFTDCSRGFDDRDAYQIIADALAGIPIPVAFDAPIGHSGRNIPLRLTDPVTLTVTPDGAEITVNSRPIDGNSR